MRLSLKVGAYLRIAAPDPHDDEDGGDAVYAQVLGQSSTEEYAKRDAAVDVMAGKSERVLIVKVVAAAKRSAAIEE